MRRVLDFKGAPEIVGIIGILLVVGIGIGFGAGAVGFLFGIFFVIVFYVVVARSIIDRYRGDKTTD